MNREEVIRNRQAWLDALRSGKFKQGRGRLHHVVLSGEERWCCLGVGACVLAELYQKDPSKWPLYGMSGMTDAGLLGYDAVKALGIPHQTRLAEMNDRDEIPFEGIADYIEGLPIPKEKEDS